MITEEGLELQREKKRTSEWVKIGITKTDSPNYEFLKREVMVEVK